MNQAYYKEINSQRQVKRLKITRGQLTYIKRISTMLNNCYVNDCNGFYNPYSGKQDEYAMRRNEARELRIENIARKFAKDNKLQIYFQTDPRGASIYLDIKKIPDNNYTQAVCIG